MSTSGPSNHLWCPAREEEGSGTWSARAPHHSVHAPAAPAHHSRCSKQQFRSVPTTPPLRTEESSCWVRGSSRWTTHLEGGTSLVAGPAAFLAPATALARVGAPGSHLSGSSRKERAAGLWLRLESSGPR